MATMMVEIVKIDEETDKVAVFHFPIPRIDKEKVPKLIEDEEKGQFAKYSATGVTAIGDAVAGLRIHDLRGICNVGDFLIIKDEVYRRIRGGWRAATDDDMAELLAAKLGEALEDVNGTKE